MAKDDIDRKIARMERAIRKDPDRFAAPAIDPTIQGKIVSLSAKPLQGGAALTVQYHTTPVSSSHTHTITPTANTTNHVYLSSASWNSNHTLP